MKVVAAMKGVSARKGIGVIKVVSAGKGAGSSMSTTATIILVDN